MSNHIINRRNQILENIQKSFVNDEEVVKSESPKELVKEHKRLVDVLNSPSHEDDKEEAKKQAKELKEYEKEADMEKGIGGEGSKGGKVIGHTKSGKAIYAKKNPSEYEGFNHQDHIDAAHHHRDESQRPENQGKKAAHHENLESLHGKQAKVVEKHGKEIGKTTSGKPIHQFKDAADYKDFTSQDHKDAADAHFEYGNERYGATTTRHMDKVKQHYKMTDEGKKHYSDIKEKRLKEDSLAGDLAREKQAEKNAKYEDIDNGYEHKKGDKVKVHPHLTKDPLNKQGHEGVVHKVDEDRDEVHVKFEDGKVGTYSGHSTLQRKQNNEIKKSEDFIEVYNSIEDLYKSGYEEIYTQTSIDKYIADLNKSFISEEIDIDEFEKGIKDLTHLEKKIITNSAGHKQTVYVRRHEDGTEHHFTHGDHVKFEHKGEQKTGHIKALKHHDVYDKFGTAEIHDEHGNKYSKSLRNIEHHHVPDEQEQEEDAENVESKEKIKLTSNDHVYNTKQSAISSGKHLVKPQNHTVAEYDGKFVVNTNNRASILAKQDSNYKIIGTFISNEHFLPEDSKSTIKISEVGSKTSNEVRNEGKRSEESDNVKWDNPVEEYKDKWDKLKIMKTISELPKYNKLQLINLGTHVGIGYKDSNKALSSLSEESIRKEIKGRLDKLRRAIKSTKEAKPAKPETEEERGYEVGKTISGKPIYSAQHADYYNDFDSEDHQDAHRIHEDISKEAFQRKQMDKAKHHDKMSESHYKKM